MRRRKRNKNKQRNRTELDQVILKACFIFPYRTNKLNKYYERRRKKASPHETFRARFLFLLRFLVGTK
jgi:hypothetical protein